MSGIESKYCLISTSYLAGLFNFFILLHIWQNCVCFGDILAMRTLDDAYHKELESHYHSIQGISGKYAKLSQTPFETQPYHKPLGQDVIGDC